MAATASPQVAATVEFEHVTKVYAGRARARTGRDLVAAPAAVHDLSLTVPAGRVCVLVGPSGCGKTTSLKMVNRLVEPTSGRILLDGVDVATRDLTELRRGIGYVIQQAGLFPHQSVLDNVATVPRLLGWPRRRQEARAAELLAMVGLEPGTYAGRYPSQLSGGERQRVGVARALAADPPLLLMDEPFGAVDPIVRERLQNELLHLQEQLAKTILFVTHDIDEAIKMGDLVAVFGTGGTVAQVGTPSEILARPASDFVARFVGTDRSLKRLALFRIGDMPITPVITARVGDSGQMIRRLAADDPWDHVLVTDADDHPLGWVHRDRIPTGPLSRDGLGDLSPLMDRRTTLKDALSMLLVADVQAGLVVDHDGTVEGMVRVPDLVAWSRGHGVAAMDPEQAEATVRAAVAAREPDPEAPPDLDERGSPGPAG